MSDIEVYKMLSVVGKSIHKLFIHLERALQGTCISMKVAFMILLFVATSYADSHVDGNHQIGAVRSMLENNSQNDIKEGLKQVLNRDLRGSSSASSSDNNQLGSVGNNFVRGLTGQNLSSIGISKMVPSAKQSFGNVGSIFSAKYTDGLKPSNDVGNIGNIGINAVRAGTLHNGDDIGTLGHDVGTSGIRKNYFNNHNIGNSGQNARGGSTVTKKPLGNNAHHIGNIAMV